MSKFEKFAYYADALRRLLFRGSIREAQWGMYLAGLAQKLKGFAPGQNRELDALKEEMIGIIRICFGRNSRHEQAVKGVPQGWNLAVEALNLCLSKMMKELGENWFIDSHKDSDLIPELQNLPQTTRKELTRLSEEIMKLLQEGKKHKADEILGQMVDLLPDLPRSKDASTSPSPLSSVPSPVPPPVSTPVVPPEDPTSRLKREANEFYGHGKFNQARELYLEYLKYVPTDVDVWNQLGEMSIQAGKKQRAEREFQEGLKCDPNNAHAKDRLEQLRRLNERKSVV